MKINKELIGRVANNARLELSEEEKEQFLLQLRDVIQNFSGIKEVNTEHLPPSFQPIAIKDVVREDVPGKCLTQEEALQNTEHKKDGFFKGPKTI